MTTTISPERAQQVIYGCDAPGCPEPWKWHDPETGLRYCDPCAARGWGHCATRCQPTRKNHLPAVKLYPPPVATIVDGPIPELEEAHAALFAAMDKKHGPVATAEVVHEAETVAAPLGELDDGTEAAMARFDAAHNAEPDDGGEL